MPTFSKLTPLPSEITFNIFTLYSTTKMRKNEIQILLRNLLIMRSANWCIWKTGNTWSVKQLHGSQTTDTEVQSTRPQIEEPERDRFRTAILRERERENLGHISSEFVPFQLHTGSVHIVYFETAPKTIGGTEFLVR